MDFQLLARFARKLNLERLANRSDFAVIAVEGFNPERVRSLKKGMEEMLGLTVKAAIVLDRDYRSEDESKNIIANCNMFCAFATIHKCKELENFILIPNAIDRAASARLADRTRRGGIKQVYKPMAEDVLEAFAATSKNYLISQLLSSRRAYERRRGSATDEATFNNEVLDDFSSRWAKPSSRLQMIQGKEALSQINGELQTHYGINITANAIVEAMKLDEVPKELHDLLIGLDQFASGSA